MWYHVRTSPNKIIFIYRLIEKGNVMKLQKQITNEELLELTKKAFENDEVAEFLCGEKGYSCPISRFVPANVPTDFGRIVNFGVFKLYEESKNEKIIKKFKEAILALTKGSAVQVWIAYSVCWNLVYKKNRKQPTLVIQDVEFWNSVKSSILASENKLRVCNEWQGINQKDGLWSNIIRMDNVLEKDYGVSVL